VWNGYLRWLKANVAGASIGERLTALIGTMTEDD
jgi:hypothetical protein